MAETSCAKSAPLLLIKSRKPTKRTKYGVVIPTLALKEPLSVTCDPSLLTLGSRKLTILLTPPTGRIERWKLLHHEELFGQEPITMMYRVQRSSSEPLQSKWIKMIRISKWWSVYPNDPYKVLFSKNFLTTWGLHKLRVWACPQKKIKPQVMTPDEKRQMAWSFLALALLIVVIVLIGVAVGKGWWKSNRCCNGSCSSSSSSSSSSSTPACGCPSGSSSSSSSSDSSDC